MDEFRKARNSESSRHNRSKWKETDDETNKIYDSNDRINDLEDMILKLKEEKHLFLFYSPIFPIATRYLTQRPETPIYPH